MSAVVGSKVYCGDDAMYSGSLFRVDPQILVPVTPTWNMVREMLDDYGTWPENDRLALDKKQTVLRRSRDVDQQYENDKKKFLETYMNYSEYIKVTVLKQQPVLLDDEYVAEIFPYFKPEFENLPMKRNSDGMIIHSWMVFGKDPPKERHLEYDLTENIYPYELQEATKSYVFWHSDPNTILDEAKELFLDHEFLKGIPEEDMLIWENHDKSVPGVWHCHILIRRASSSPQPNLGTWSAMTSL